MIAAIVLVLWALDVDDGGWIASGTSGQWEWGVATTGPGGPKRMWATNLDGFALNDATDFLEIPLPALDGTEWPVLEIRHWYHFGPGDHGVLEVDPGTGWQVLDPAYGYPDPAGFVGASGAMVQDSFPLAAYGPNPRVRLVFASDASLSAEGWYVDSATLYDGDVTPPDLRLVDGPSDTTDLDGPYPVVVEARDDFGLTAVRLVFAIDGGPEQTVPLAPDGPDTFGGEIAGQPPGTLVTWRVEADDRDHTTRLPAAGDASFRVYLPAPTNLQGPQGRVIGNSIGLHWDPPDALPPVVGYEVRDDLDGRTFAELPFAAVPVTGSGPHSWTVRARYDIGGGPVYGDPSEPLALDVEVPVLDPLVPDAAGPGEHRWITVTGQSLYLAQDVVSVDLGDGVLVEDVDVLDAERAMARVTVLEDAVPGPRDARITGAQGTFRFPGAFEVLDQPVAGSEAVITPSILFQGRPTSVTVTAPVPFAGPVEVDPGPDLVVLGDVEVDGEKLHFDLLAPLGAAPGPRTLILDDGSRIFGADLSVRASITEVQGRCAVVPGPFPGAALVGLLLFATRRRR